MSFHSFFHFIIVCISLLSQLDVVVSHSTLPTALPLYESYHVPEQYVNVTTLFSSILALQFGGSAGLIHRLPKDFHHLRILHVVNSYNMNQFDSLLVLVQASTQFCEFGWYVRLVIQTTVCCAILT